MSTEPTNVTAPAKAYVRAAQPSELDEMVKMFRRAFIDDPMMNYGGNVSSAQPLSNEHETPGRRHLEAFFYMLTRCVFIQKGIVSVVVVPQENSDEKKSEAGKAERIVAAALWLPPRNRIGVGRPMDMVKAGLFKALKGWGLRGFKRLAIEYADTAEHAWNEIYREKGLYPGEKELDAWYLQLCATDPDAQGKGYLSLLIRDAFAQHPNDVIALEATTPKSRDRYEHLGFKLERAVRIGKGQCNAKGQRVSKKNTPSAATTNDDKSGFEYWVMAKWKPESTV